jgi:hypothetical protein
VVMSDMPCYARGYDWTLDIMRLSKGNSFQFTWQFQLACHLA